MSYTETGIPRINKCLLSVIGMWPYQDSATKICGLAFTIFGLINYVIPQLVFAFRSINDLDGLILVMPTNIGSCIAIAKVSTMMYNNFELKLLLNRMSVDWEYFTVAAELGILKNFASRTRKLCYIYTGCLVGPVAVFVLLPLTMPLLDIIMPSNTSRPRVFLNPVDYLIDHQKYYYIILLNQYIGYAVIVLISVASDLMFITVTQHTCALFAVLNNRLENMVSFDERTTFRSIDCIYRHVSECIQLHVRVRELVETINSLFSTFFLMDIALGILLHSTACVMFVIQLKRGSDWLKYVLIIAGQSSRLFWNSLPGQNLMDSSSRVAVAAYNGLWYQTPKQVKRLVILLIMRSQTPCTITIAKLYPISLDSFGMVIKTSVSYCTVLASIHDVSESE